MLTATSPPGEAEGGQEEQPQAGRGESGRHSSAHLSAPPQGPGEAPALPAAPLRCGLVLSRGWCRCAPRRCHIPHCHGPARTRFITAAVRNRPGKCRFPRRGPEGPVGLCEASPTLPSGRHRPHRPPAPGTTDRLSALSTEG